MTCHRSALPQRKYAGLSEYNRKRWKVTLDQVHSRLKNSPRPKFDVHENPEMHFNFVFMDLHGSSNMSERNISERHSRSPKGPGCYELSSELRAPRPSTPDLRVGMSGQCTTFSDDCPKRQVIPFHTIQGPGKVKLWSSFRVHFTASKRGRQVLWITKGTAEVNLLGLGREKTSARSCRPHLPLYERHLSPQSHKIQGKHMQGHDKAIITTYGRMREVADEEQRTYSARRHGDPLRPFCVLRPLQEVARLTEVRLANEGLDMATTSTN
ncbi:hypothetical protein BC629DRAFT_1446129 [Irpex lacteus]|nr:hypothetical protein BC629DRAFT_1446129 [Irpex lacteus]